MPACTIGGVNNMWQLGMTLEDLEREAILKAYSFYGKNKTHTAAALGIAIRTLDSKLSKYLPKEEAKNEIQHTG